MPRRRKQPELDDPEVIRIMAQFPPGSILNVEQMKALEEAKGAARERLRAESAREAREAAERAAIWHAEVRERQQYQHAEFARRRAERKQKAVREQKVLELSRCSLAQIMMDYGITTDHVRQNKFAQVQFLPSVGQIYVWESVVGQWIALNPLNQRKTKANMRYFEFILDVLDKV